jgi:bacterioferritin (cytochrome b1)
MIWMIWGHDDGSKILYNNLMHERELHNQTKKILATCEETSKLFERVKKENEK